MYANIVVGLPIEGPFTYEIPSDLADRVSIGKRVWMPFANRRLVGYVIGLTDSSSIPGLPAYLARAGKNIKPIYSVIDEEPILSDDILKTTKWISEYYFCSWGEAIEAAMPPALKRGKGLGSRVKAQETEEEDIKPSFHLTPTEEQDRVLKALWHDIDSNRHNVYLLHGITGSGKTEVYLQAIGKALKMGKSSIMLVPEISLTPQTIERFKSRFKDEVAILHSRLTNATRFIEWKKIKDGKAMIVVGARSAIFAPVGNLGLIVIDEEHETSYKQQDSPRYHAREVAIKRAFFANAVVILGSATPSLESYYKAKKGIFKFVNLTQRIEDRTLPPVQIIDMRQYIDSSRRQAMLSKPMQDSIKAVLDKKEQAILFLNRRGFATFMNCKKCGFVLKCKNCDVTLVYHYQQKKLVCHWCNYQLKPPEMCPQCKSSYISYFGIGTEKVESEINRLFANAHTSRMDTDATTKRGSHKDILDSFKLGNTELLVGTQMIAKGLDYPGVTLVGVVSADSALHIPDFRSGERTFNLLTQVAGRAGRGKTKGKVLVQTFTPGHYAITCASKHDYATFFQKEMACRKQLQLPPYTHLVKITFRSRSQNKTIDSAKRLAELLKDKDSSGNKKVLQIIGPVFSSIPRLRREYRWDVILKAKKAEDAVSLLRKSMPNFKKPSAVRMAVDVDPL